MHVATYTSGYPNKLKTARQWARAGFLPKESCSGEEYWTNWGFTASAIYFTDQEVRPATEEELEAFWRPYKDKRNEAARRRRAEKKREEKELEEYKKKLLEETEQAQKELLAYSALAENSVPCDNASRTICFDVETTGLNPKNDEILQISIIDGEGGVLLSTYVKPKHHTSWYAAQKIHKITPEMVIDAPSPEDIIPVLQGIFDSADLVLGYNVYFDIGFIEKWAINLKESCTVCDVMKDFAEVYGEWSDYYGGYKWQSLSTAAAYYDYDFDAHDSLEDVRATLYVYRKMHETESSEN